ncbi:MAG: hypothetical protein HY958_07615 [Bacteroidia bacterium]|nr:hypothetical protein [Bacteroidia bacterium]
MNNSYRFTRACIISLFFVFFSNIIFSQDAAKISYVFNRNDIQLFFDNNNNTSKKLEFSIAGISTRQQAKELKNNSSGFKKMKIKNYSPEKTRATALFNLNIDNFRNVLEQNNISSIVVDGITIRTANLITQEKALSLANSIIDIPAIKFDASYNKADNLGYYEFRVYYYETKLYDAMHNYYQSLLQGVIDQLQDAVKNAKEEKEDFIKQHTN